MWTASHAQFASTRVHPFARLLSRRPRQMLVSLYVVYVVLSIAGVRVVKVSFGSPSGRNAYSPSRAIETYRMDMYINAQDTVSVTSGTTEQQTHAFPGFQLMFEVVRPDGAPNVDADIFTPDNLALMRRAQQTIERAPGFTEHCLRCPFDEPRACTLAKRAMAAAHALVNALSNASASDIGAAATGAAQHTVALCNEVRQTCPISECAAQARASVEANSHLGGALSELRELAGACVLGGAIQARNGVCATTPGCGGARKGAPRCQRTYSPLAYFYSDDGYERGQNDDIPNGWRALDSEIELPQTSELARRISWAPASFFLPREYDKGDRRTHRTRLQVVLGLPLEGHPDVNDRREEQEDKANAWLIRTYPRLEALRAEYEAANYSMRLRWVASDDVVNYVFREILNADIRYAICALLFVGCYVACHTRSLFVSAVSMAGVMLCFTVGTFWSIQVCGITFFDPLNIFLLYVVVGLGADGIFIVFDAFEQSRGGMVYWRLHHGEEEAGVYRMSYVWRRTSKAMLATNLTTALAFVANVPAAVMPMSAFGALATFVIVHNMLLDVVAVPCIVVIWEQSLRSKRACCRTPSRRADVASVTGAGVERAGAPVITPAGGSRKATECRGARALDESAEGAIAAAAAATREESGPHVPKRVEAFFANVYAPFVIRFRASIALVSVAVVGVFLAHAARLEAAREPPQFLPDDNPLWIALTSLRDGWRASESDPRSELYLIWGIKANEYGRYTSYQFGTDACDGGPCGEAVWDDFDPSPPDVQRYLARACDDARELRAPGAGDAEFIEQQRISACLMHDFRAWLAESSTAFPVEPADRFWREMHEFLRPPSDGRSAGRGYRHIERKLTRVGTDGAARMFFLISAVETSFKPELFYSVPEVLRARDADYAFEAKQNTKRPQGLTPFFVSTSSGLFTAMRMQQAYVSSTFRGVLVALCLALALLVAFVGNVIVALVAFACITSVVGCTLGAIVMLSWSLGPIEAICATIVTGFSVDFCVHYALAYCEAPERTRHERLTRALVEMGISVQSGAITTMGASAFLLATNIRFLFQFGVFMLLTVAFSLVVANLLFTSLIAIVGPQDDVGSVRALCARVRASCANGSRERQPEASTPAAATLPGRVSRGNVHGAEA